MRVLRAWRVGVCAGVLLVAGWALAGDPAGEYPQCNRTPTPADLEGAKGAHKAATQFYERADYERAIQYWRDAYEFDCTAHGVLINIANAYEKKGDRERAIAALEAYLTRAPDAPDAPTIQEKVQNLKSSLKPVVKPPPAPTASASAPPPTPTASASAAPPPEGPRPYGYNPWIAVGAGGAAMVVGAILVPVGLGAISDAEAECPGRVNCSQEVADKGNSGRTQAALGAAALGLGAAGVAGGLVWQFMFNKPAEVAAPAAAPAPAARKASGTRVMVAPAVGPGFGGLSVGGKF